MGTSKGAERPLSTVGSPDRRPLQALNPTSGTHAAAADVVGGACAVESGDGGGSVVVVVGSGRDTSVWRMIAAEATTGAAAAVQTQAVTEAGILAEHVRRARDAIGEPEQALHAVESVLFDVGRR